MFFKQNFCQSKKVECNDVLHLERFFLFSLFRSIEIAASSLKQQVSHIAHLMQSIKQKHEEENVDNNCIKTKKKICFDFDYSIFVLFLVIKFKKRDMMVMMKFDDHWMVSTTTMKIHGRENTKVVVVVVVVVIIVFVVFIHCLLSSLMCRIFSFSLFIFLMIIIFF